MAPTPLRLRHRDVLRTLEEFDPLDVVARELAGERPERGGRVSVTAMADTTTVRDRETGRICLLLTPSLRMAALAALSTVAARELLAPTAVTAAVLGAGPSAQLHLALLARHLPTLSSAVVHPAALAAGRAALAGTAAVLSADIDPGEAARGANLLVVAEPGWGTPEIGTPRPGTVIVNATRRDLPEDVLAAVDRVYVDDLDLVEHNQHRAFVRAHLRPRGRRIAAGLGEVLSAGLRAGVDDVVLVELFEAGRPAARLAAHIYLAAVALGLDHQ